MADKKLHIEELKKEFANDRRYKTLDELGLTKRMEYDPSRKTINHLNSGYFVRSKEGDIVDISEQAYLTGYVYVTWDDLEERLNKGGRLATGTTTWRSEEV